MFFTEARDEPTSPLKHVAVLSGASCSFRCPNDERRISWYHIPSHSNVFTNIYNGYELADESMAAVYRVSETTEQSELTLNNTLPMNSGRYLCEQAGTERKFDAELVVLG